MNVICNVFITASNTTMTSQGHTIESKCSPSSSSSPPHSLSSTIYSQPTLRSSIPHDSVVLPIDFEPSDYTVVLGRGGKESNSKLAGNRRLKELIEEHFLQRYTNVTSRPEKSEIVTQIISTFQAMGNMAQQQQGPTSRSATATSTPSFVRRDLKSGRWLDVGIGHAGKGTQNKCYRSFKVGPRPNLVISPPLVNPQP